MVPSSLQSYIYASQVFNVKLLGKVDALRDRNFSQTLVNSGLSELVHYMEVGKFGSFR